MNGTDFAYVTVTVVTVAITAGIALADLARVRIVVANMDEVGVPRAWLTPLATVKLAGALGLIIGLAGVQPVGLAAASGLVLFFVGAVSWHIRAHVLYNVAFPGTFLALSVASLLLAISH